MPPLPLRSVIPAAWLAALVAAPAWATPPEVTVDTAITASLVSLVLGDLAQPKALLPRGASAHHYQMRPSEAAALQSADLLVWMGPALTPWLQRPAGQRGATDDLTLLDAPGTALRNYGAAVEGDHDHDHGGDHGDDDHSGIDPHAWLDPANAAPWLAAIANRLAALDPEHAPDYRANATAATARMVDLDARIAAELAPARGQHFVVFHDAYGYFTDHYGLSPAIAVSLGDAASPSAARLSEVRQEVARSGAACAFPEAGHDARLVAAAIEGSGARLGSALDPEGTEAEPGPGLYEALLEGLADALSGCLSR